MDKTVVCLIDMFSNNFKVDLVAAHSITPIGRFASEQIAEVICNYCYSNGIDKVLLLGNADYVSKYVRQMKKIEFNTYQKNRLKIEVNS